MSDEIDEITGRSGPPSTLGVYGRQDPEPAVVLVLRFNRGMGSSTPSGWRTAPPRRAGCRTICSALPMP
jgi:hypothetical protein